MIYNVKINAEISIDIDAANHHDAVNEAQYEVEKTLKCFFGDDNAVINSIAVIEE